MVKVGTGVRSPMIRRVCMRMCMHECKGVTQSMDLWTFCQCDSHIKRSLQFNSCKTTALARRTGPLVRVSQCDYRAVAVAAFIMGKSNPEVVLCGCKTLKLWRDRKSLRRRNTWFRGTWLSSSLSPTVVINTIFFYLNCVQQRSIPHNPDSLYMLTVLW